MFVCSGPLNMKYLLQNLVVYCHRTHVPVITDKYVFFYQNCSKIGLLGFLCLIRLL